jgi:hypothetical protein
VSATGGQQFQQYSQADEISAGLRRLATLPDWLRAALDAQLVAGALRQQVPEFAAGALRLRGCKIKRLLLKDDDGRWSGTYNLTIEEPGAGAKRAVALRGTLTAPRLRQGNGGEQHEISAFGAEGWRCVLPELGLELEPELPDTALAAMPQLTDPEQARALLERSIRERTPAYADMRIVNCTPEVLSYKPGSRCVIRYHLEYPPELAERGWPATVIAKTYRKDSKARNAFDGMQALWSSPLASGESVAIAEPLAYVSELKLLVQAPIAEDLTLEDMLKSALRAGTPEHMEELYGYMRKAAAGLAAFHHSGARHGEPVALEDRFPEIRTLIGRLMVAEPELGHAATPLLRRLETFAAAHPAGILVPTHGTFNPEQVLIHQDRIGFIDFDDFCMAEPALDVGLFCSAIRDTGMGALDDDAGRQAREARLAQLDAICDVFVAEYAAHAPIERERVALWQALDFLRNCLHYWTKAKPAEPDTPTLVLEHLLRGMGLYAVPVSIPAPPALADPAALSFVGGALLTAAIYAPSPALVALLALLAAASMAAGGAAWKQIAGWIDGYPRAHRLYAAGALGFSMSALAVMFSLAEIESLALANLIWLPAHVLFAVLFATAVFVVAAATGGALGMALRSRRASAALALAGGLAASLAFLAVDITLEASGVHVDTLGLTSLAGLETLALGDLAALVAGGAVIALVLARYLASAVAEPLAIKARVQ